MATLSTQWPTLLDVAKSLDPNGQVAKVAEVLNQHNEILDDIPMVEGNLPTGHQVTLRKTIPTPTWRLANTGVTRVKATNGQVTEGAAVMANYSEIDKMVAELNGNTASFRLSQDKGIMEGMNQEFSRVLAYGDATLDPEQFTGLSPRYFSTNSALSPTYGQVIKAGGVGSDNASIWLVGWSPETVFGFYPKGSQAGLVYRDLGEQTVYDSALKPFQAYRSYFEWKCGIAVADWRYVVRICNIDISALETASDASDTSANILKYMSMAADKLYSLQGVQPVFYANQRVRAMLNVKLFNKTNWLLTREDVKGASGITRPTIMFQGIPVRRLDQLTVAESLVS